MILIWGAIVMGFAFWAEFAFDPPYWLFVLLLIPITLGGGALLMRPGQDRADGAPAPSPGGNGNS